MASCSSSPPALVLLLLAVIFTAVSLPSIHSSARPSFVAETIPLSASMEMSERGDGRLVVLRGGRDSAASAREVPTGPNPLHHNHNPNPITKPRKDHHIVARP